MRDDGACQHIWEKGPWQSIILDEGTRLSADVAGKEVVDLQLHPQVSSDRAADLS
jgi:hypothetical protein